MSQRLKIILVHGAIVLVVGLVLLIISYWFFVPDLSQRLSDYRVNNENLLLSSKIQQIEGALSVRIAHAKNLSESDIIVGSIILSDRDDIGLIARINDHKFLNHKIPTSLYDFMGQSIYQTQDFPFFEADTMLMVVDSLMNDSEYVYLASMPDKRLVIFLPVYYQGFIEGFIGQSYPVDFQTIISDESNFNHNYEMKLNFQLGSFTTDLITSDFKHTVKGRLSEFPVNYLISFDISENISQQLLIEDDLKKSLLFIIISSMAVLFLLGYSLLVSPFILLKKTEKKLTENQIKLESALKDAEVAKDIKSRFLANMSHEIRTPMNAILMSLNMASDTDNDQQQRNFINIALSATSSLLQIIDDILDFSKLEEGKFHIQIRPFSIKSFFAKVRVLVSPLLSKKGLSFYSDISGASDIFLLGDEIRLRQVVINLLSNAIKFTDHGHVTFNVAYEIENEHAKVVITISDTGPGITPENQHHIFERFTQLTQDEKYIKGTGLGLAICQQLVTLMGGDIWCESQVGKGSTFFVTLTLPLSSGSHVLTIENDPALEGISLKILVAEDQEVNQMLIQAALEKLGHTVVCVENGQQALDELYANPCDFDVVLMDNNMPVMSGCEAVRILRSSGTVCSTIPVLAISADAMVEQQQQFIEAGMDGFVSKPIEIDVLTNEIERVISEHSWKRDT